MIEKQKIKIILFVSSLLCILLLFMILDLTQPIKSNNPSKQDLGKIISIEGTISSINFYQNSISIYLENYSAELLLFTSDLIDLKKQDKIEAIGKLNIETNKTQLIVDKIIKK